MSRDGSRQAGGPAPCASALLWVRWMFTVTEDTYSEDIKTVLSLENSCSLPTPQHPPRCLGRSPLGGFLASPLQLPATAYCQMSPCPPTWANRLWLLLTPRITPALPPPASAAQGWWPPSRRCSHGALPVGPASARSPWLFPQPGPLSPFSHFSAEPAFLRGAFPVCLSDNSPHARVSLQPLTPLDLPSEQLPT